MAADNATITRTEPPEETEQRREHVSARKRAFRQIKEDRMALVGAVIVVVMSTLAIFSTVDQFILERQVISTVLHDPYSTAPEMRLAEPSLDHPFGTDHQGRDNLARVIYGARTSIVVGLAAVGFASTAGVAIGIATAYYGDAVDMVGMRAMDIILAFPAILLAIALMAVFGRGIENVIFALGIVYVPTFARITRSEVLSEKSEEYVDAARVIGYPNRTIMRRELLPNCLTPITVQFTFTLALAIIAEAALSFLGVGVSPTTPSWGIMLANARDYMRLEWWWFSAFPGLAIMITVLGFNLLGDSLRDALDPRQSSDQKTGRM
ncbi:ABC transporter permease (plasmid) [Haloferacaceae archaeon DSL9]